MDNLVFNLEKKNLLSKLKMDFGKGIPVHETTIYDQLIKAIDECIPVTIEYRPGNSFVKSNFIYFNDLSDNNKITLRFEVTLHKECNDNDVAVYLIDKLENLCHEIGLIEALEMLLARTISDVLDLDCMWFDYSKKLPNEGCHTYSISVTANKFY